MYSVNSECKSSARVLLVHVENTKLIFSIWTVGGIYGESLGDWLPGARTRHMLYTNIKNIKSNPNDQVLARLLLNPKSGSLSTPCMGEYKIGAPTLVVDKPL